jgi:hypothetical protein
MLKALQDTEILNTRLGRDIDHLHNRTAGRTKDVFQALTESTGLGTSRTIGGLTDQILAHARAVPPRPYIVICHSQGCVQTSQAVKDALAAASPTERDVILASTGVLALGGFTTDDSFPTVPNSDFAEHVRDPNDPVPSFAAAIDVTNPYRQIEGAISGLFGLLTVKEHSLTENYLVGEHLAKAIADLDALLARVCSGPSTPCSATTTSTLPTLCQSDLDCNPGANAQDDDPDADCVWRRCEPGDSQADVSGCTTGSASEANGSVCDDGVDCTTASACFNGGLCSAAGVWALDDSRCPNQDDGDANCTRGVCKDLIGCRPESGFEPNGSPCVDFDGCTGVCNGVGLCGSTQPFCPCPPRCP